MTKHSIAQHSTQHVTEKLSTERVIFSCIASGSRLALIDFLLDVWCNELCEKEAFYKGNLMQFLGQAAVVQPSMMLLHMAVGIWRMLRKQILKLARF